MRRRVRLINFRLPFATALSFALGIAVTYFCKYYSGGYSLMLAPIALSALWLLACFIFGRGSCVYPATIFAAFAAAFFICSFALERFAVGEAAEGINSLISGSVKETGEASGKGFYLILSDVTVNGERVFGDMRVGNVTAVCPPPRSGYRVSFVGEITKYDLIAYGGLNYHITNGIKYSAVVRGCFETEYGFSLFAAIRAAMSDALYENLDDETAAVVLAMLTGNSSLISEPTLDSFRFGGIAHIFAVSGLHIGVLYGVFIKLFKSLRLNRFAAGFITIAVIIFYSGVCGFTPSSVRAAVMCAALTLSELIFKKYDSLNALSIAAILLMIINPLNLFDVGFVLSVSSILGIVFLCRRIENVLFRLPRKISQAVGVTLSAQAGTLPALYLNFGYISGAGLLLNLVVLPLLSSLYVIIFFSLIACLIIPPLAPVALPVVCLPMEAVINLSVSSGFENALLKLSCGWFFLPAYALCLLTLSDKLNLSGIFRSLVSSVCVCAVALSCAFSGAAGAGYARISVTSYYGGGAVAVKTDEGTTLIVTEEFNSSRLQNDLNGFCIGDIDAAVILGGDSCAEKFYSLGTEADSLYLAGRLIYLGDIRGVNTVYSDNFSVCGADYAFCGSDGIFVTVNGVSLGIFADEPPEGAYADMLICASGAKSLNAEISVFFEGGRGGYDIYDCGGLQFSAEDGKLSTVGLIPAR